MISERSRRYNKYAKFPATAREGGRPYKLAMVREVRNIAMPYKGRGSPAVKTIFEAEYVRNIRGGRSMIRRRRTATTVRNTR